MSYIIISSFMGLLCIAVGFIVKKYPRTMSGYSHLVKAGVEQDAIIKYVNLISKCLYVTGVIVVVGGLVAYFGGWPFGQAFVLIIPPLVMTLFIITQAPKITKITVISSFVFLLSLIGVLLFVSREPTVIITYDGIDISGIYGETIRRDEIRNFSLVDTMPEPRLRVNGLGLGPIKKGYFKLDSLGKVKLFLSSLDGPFFKIDKKDSTCVFINSRDSVQTIKYYNEMFLYFRSDHR